MKAERGGLTPLGVPWLRVNSREILTPALRSSIVARKTMSKDPGVMGSREIEKNPES